MAFIRFGPFDIAPVETGRFRLDGGAMFGVVPKNLWERNNPADERNRIAMTMRTLLVRSGERLILVDAGVGNKEDEKFRSIFALDFNEYSLDSELRRLGVAREQVTDVVLTHLHFDHAGGIVTGTEDGLQLTFPNAVHYVQKRQWEWALHPSDRDRASYKPDNYMPVHEAGRMQLVDGPEELFPGISVEVVDGHTFGQQLLRLRDGDQSLVYAADLIPMSAHVPGPWIMGYDLQPLLTLEEKTALLEQAAAKRDLLFFEHDPGVEASAVVNGERGFAPASAGTLADSINAVSS